MLLAIYAFLEIVFHIFIYHIFHTFHFLLYARIKKDAKKSSFEQENNLKNEKGKGYRNTTYLNKKGKINFINRN
ncbi:hypothetical protein BACI71_40517 [Bacillus mycoides]|uniref:Uncharacterized protein n=1 Tax=Bacillus mycoides TaxID=1405 RepID=A0A654A7Z3_BACMY|nr:hypothetical protein BACI71_40517 [Bacillus mycoides]